MFDKNFFKVALSFIIAFVILVAYTAANAETSNHCNSIRDNDLRHYCQNRCSQIRNDDLRNYCFDRCSSIRDNDMRYLCRARKAFPRR